MKHWRVVVKIMHTSGNVYTVSYWAVPAKSEQGAIDYVAQKLQSDEYPGEIQSMQVEPDDDFAMECMRDYDKPNRYWTGD